MKTLEEYFDQVRQLVENLSDAHVERYEEQIFSTTRGNLRIRLRFPDNALLEISEALVLVEREWRWLSYRYHYQDAFASLIFRYDNAPHHPEISTHPNHKHNREQILASDHPLIEQVLEEMKTIRGED